MAKLTLNDVQNLENSDTAKNTINNNNTLLETTVERILFRDGTNPNHMTADLDMNSNRILNLPAPIDPTEPIRKKDMDNLDAFDNILALQAAVDAAEDSAAAALGSENAARNWATQQEDVVVATPPDQFSAMHWAKKAQAAASVTSGGRIRLTQDTVFWTGLGGNDSTGDGTQNNPWYSVARAFYHVMSHVDCNGFMPVIMLKPGFYDQISNTYPGGFEPAGFLTWGAPYGKEPDNNVVDPGGAMLEVVGNLVGKQVTGGGPLTINGGFDGERPDQVIIRTVGTTFNALHGGVLILNALTLTSTTGQTLYATQGGIIQLGSNVCFAGSGGSHCMADLGGRIIVSGNIQQSGGSGHSFFHANGVGSSISIGDGQINLQYSTNGNLGTPNPGVPGLHHPTAFITASQGGQIIAGTPQIIGVASASTKKYLANNAGSILHGGMTTRNAQGVPTIELGDKWPGIFTGQPPNPLVGEDMLSKSTFSWHL